MKSLALFSLAYLTLAPSFAQAFSFPEPWKAAGVRCAPSTPGWWQEELTDVDHATISRDARTQVSELVTKPLATQQFAQVGGIALTQGHAYAIRLTSPTHPYPRSPGYDCSDRLSCEGFGAGNLPATLHVEDLTTGVVHEIQGFQTYNHFLIGPVSHYNRHGTIAEFVLWAGSSPIVDIHFAYGDCQNLP